MAIQVHTIDEDGVGRVLILKISGDMTSGTGDVELREEFKGLLDAGGRRFILDLTRVRYMDSACLGETLACQKRALERDAKIKLVLVPQGKPDELFRITRLDRVFDIFPDEQAALAGFRD